MDSDGDGYGDNYTYTNVTGETLSDDTIDGLDIDPRLIKPVFKMVMRSQMSRHNGVISMGTVSVTITRIIQQFEGNVGPGSW